MHSMNKLPKIFDNVFLKLSNFNRCRNYFLPNPQCAAIASNPSHALIKNWNLRVPLSSKNIALDKPINDKEQINHIKLFEKSLTDIIFSKYNDNTKCDNKFCKDCK